MENNEKNNNSITLADLFMMFKRRIWWLVGIFAAGVVITLICVLALVKPTYKSTSSVLVNPEKFQSSSSSSDVSGGLRATQTISSWIVDESILQDAIDDMVAAGVIKHDEYKPSDLKDMISIKNSTSDLFIYVSLTSKNKEFAKTALDYVINSGIDKSVEKDNLGEYKYPVTANSYNVVTPANNAVNAGKSKKLYALVGALVSLVVACCVVICIELFKNKYSTVDEVKKSLNLPILGYQYDDKEGLNKENLDSEAFINKTNYDKLVTNIDFSIINKENNVISFTSTDSGECKTTTVMNIARILSSNNRKVLVIDLDLRRPVLHMMFNEDKKDGITEYVTSDCNINIKNFNEYISVITSGVKVPNPSIILESKKLSDIINSLKSDYDYVLIDCPPVTVSSDAKVITKLSDALVYVIAANKAKVSEVKKSIAEINTDEANIIGVNVTLLKGSKKDKYYYSNYYTSEKREK